VVVKEEIVRFASAKLLLSDPFTVEELSSDQILACLSRRIPIEFNSTNYIARTKERRQVEGHMRVCLKIDADLENITTISSSEPLLSEAAYAIMQKPSFNGVKALQSIMGDFAVSKGDRGEFLVLLFLILARDKAVGPVNNLGRPQNGKRWFGLSDLLYGPIFRRQVPSPQVTRSSIDSLKQISRDLPRAQLHFNHFIRVHESKAIDLTSLLLLQGRGAAVLCPANQTGIDAIITFLKNGTTLTRANAGLILIQIKNDPKYSDVSRGELFAAMDPRDHEIIKEGDEAVPLIKVVFALAAQSHSLHVVRHEPSKEYNAPVYEIWCAGLSPRILGPIDRQQEGVWQELLQASYGWKDIYKMTSTVRGDLRRSATPGAALHSGHYACWADRE
jgi:hypothetical protein